MSTKRRIAEQVLRRISGGDPSAGSRVDIREIVVALGQMLAKRLQLSHFDITMGQGETIPAGTMLARYGEGAVKIRAKAENNGKVCRITLPAMPINLPRNMGIFHVGPLSDPDCGYIPMQAGQYGVVKKLVGMSTLLGQAGYWPVGRELFFSKDVSDVDLLIILAVMDIDKYDDWAQLPISEDMEAEAIEALVQMFLPRVDANKIVDSQTSK